jgi:hypothetical protein
MLPKKTPMQELEQKHIAFTLYWDCVRGFLFMKVADSCNQNTPFPTMLESGEFTVFNSMENSAVILLAA